MRDPLIQLLNDSKQDGRWESSGQFTVDLNRAVLKLGENFSRAYPGHYVLKFVQSAVAFQCDSVEVNSRKGRFGVTLQGVGKENLVDYFQFALENLTSLPKVAPPYPFFQGVWSLFAEGAEELDIEVEDGQDFARYTYRNQQFQKAEGNDGGTRGEPQKRISLRSSRPSSVGKLEKSLVTERCQFAPLDVTLNGKKIRRDGWATMSSVESADWYKTWAPHGFRLGECYLVSEDSQRTQSIRLPDPMKRGPRLLATDWAWEPADWWPKSNNVFYHRGHRGLLFNGAVAKTLDRKLENPVTAVQLGVTLEPLFSLSCRGSLAVVECESHGLKTDVFGLRLVETAAIPRLSRALESQSRSLTLELGKHIKKLDFRRTSLLSKLRLHVGPNGSREFQKAILMNVPGLTRNEQQGVYRLP